MRGVILLWMLMPLQGFAESAVWRVSSEVSEIYLGGTIHVLSRNDYPLPEEFEQAYMQADSVVLETDLKAMQQAGFQQRLLQQVMYRDGGTLKNNLTPDTYRQLKVFVSGRGLSMASIEPYQPSMVTMLLTMYELQRLGMDENGVDTFFSNRAVQDGKPLAQLESLASQLNLLAGMGRGHADALILNTIQELNALPAIMKNIKAAWRSGDLPRLEKIAVDPMRKQFPAIYQSLLVNRNRIWIPKIEAMLATPKKEFVLVGVLHLVSRDGVLEQLIQRGYQVEKW